MVKLATKMLDNSSARDKSSANPSGQPRNPIQFHGAKRPGNEVLEFDDLHDNSPTAAARRPTNFGRNAGQADYSMNNQSKLLGAVQEDKANPNLRKQFKPAE